MNSADQGIPVINGSFSSIKFAVYQGMEMGK